MLNLLMVTNSYARLNHIGHILGEVTVYVNLFDHMSMTVHEVGYIVGQNNATG